MNEWAIPKDNRMVHQIWSDKTTENCFNLPNNRLMLCFDKLTSEHNNKKHFYFFILLGNIFKQTIIWYEVEIIKLNRVDMEYQYYLLLHLRTVFL